MQDNRDNLINKLTEIVGPENVLTDHQIYKYHRNTLSFSQSILCAVLVKSTKTISPILKLANKFQIPVYPFSTGHNWGYGCATPTVNNAIALDLSELKQIEIIDAQHGLFAIEPGVTQGMMYEFLIANQLDYMVPTTGAGPNCSLIGNALERGYGLNPNQDHLSALMSYECVLADGETYCSPLKLLGCEKVAHYYRYGVGPYIDGLFSQANYAIITKATIALKPAPKYFEIIYFSIKSNDDLTMIVDLIRRLLKDYPGIINAMNLMNKDRIESTLKIRTTVDTKYHWNIMNLLFKNQEMQWIAFGCLYGSKAVIKAAKKEIKTILKLHVDKMMFMSKKKLALLEATIKRLPIFKKDTILLTSVEQLMAVRDFLTGRPSEIELRLAYEKFNIMPEDNKSLNPTRQGIGLIWFPPLVPLSSESVRKFVDIVDTVSSQFNNKSLITLTTLSQTCFNATIPIFFDANNEADKIKAKRYYQTLFHACKDAGFYPYRLDIESMKNLHIKDNIHGRLAKRIKQAIDPNDIIAPGRYVD